MIVWIIIGVLVILGIIFMLWCTCAAGPKDSLDYQLDCLRKEYAKKQRNKIRVKVDGRYY